MKYALLIHPGDTAARVAELSAEEQKQIMDEWITVAQSPGVLAAHQLHPVDTATTVRVADGRTLTIDGPFIEAKEAIGGVMLLEADDLDGAISFAARIPVARLGGAVEVRPVVER
jgi:hypothetical protein